MGPVCKGIVINDWITYISVKMYLKVGNNLAHVNLSGHTCDDTGF